MISIESCLLYIALYYYITGDDVDGINVTETDDLDNGQQGRAVEHQTSTGSTLVVHGSYKANNIQEETLLKEEALPPCLIALISGSMTAEGKQDQSEQLIYLPTFILLLYRLLYVVQ